MFLDKLYDPYPLRTLRPEWFKLRGLGRMTTRVPMRQTLGLYAP